MLPSNHARAMAAVAAATAGVALAAWTLGKRAGERQASIATPPRSSAQEECKEDAAGESSEGFVATPEHGFTPSNPWWILPVLKWICTGEPPERDPPMPPLLHAPADTLIRTQPVPAFGKEMRERWFLVDREIQYLNHGSYGGTLKHALDAQRFFQDHLEKNPVNFMNAVSLGLLVQSIRKLAAFVNSRPQDIVLVPNATTGANAVARSFPLKAGDVVLSFAKSYPAVHNAIDYACRRTGAKLVCIPLAFPVTDEAVKAAVKKALDENPTAKLAFFDHIKDLVTICHARDCKVFVDGAHAVGQLPLDLSELGADYYTSNLHKWMCTPKGSAFLWVAERCQHHVRPTTMSHGYGLGFATEFFWQATMDLTAYAAVSTAIAAFERVGVDKIREYNHNLAVWAGDMLQERWGTTLVHAPGPHGSLITVRVPSGHFKANNDDAVGLMRLLRYKYRVEAPISVLNGDLIVRLSAQMYNDRSEYEALAAAVQEIQSGLTVMQ